MRPGILSLIGVAGALALPVVATAQPSSTVASAPSSSAAELAASAALRDRAMAGDNDAYALVEGLTTEIGPRPAASPAFHRAAHWALARMQALGLQNVHGEPFLVTRWIRGEERAEVTAPFPQRLAVTAIGGSVATPPGGIEAPVALFRSYEEFLEAPRSAIEGRIVVVTQPMPVGGYAGYFRIRSQGANEAARRGALAYLLRSLATGDRRAPHTGTLFYDEAKAGEPARVGIPAAAISGPDAEQLDRMAARGLPLRLRLVLTSTSEPNQQTETIVGEIPGRDPGAGVVLIGAHLDSWDLGTGALDDGAGVGVTLAAAKLIASLPVRPLRTIRVVLFGAEEIGEARKAYAAAHGAAEQARIAIASECDLGADHIYSIQLPPGAQDGPFAHLLARAVQPLGTSIADEPATDGGGDLDMLSGVPLANLRQEDTRYFDFHHSADDTLDKIDRTELNQNVAAWAVFTYLAANSPQSFRQRAPAK
ncbi:MAG TPA: M28 family peptidase [Sphingomicrobium sp.]|nr:M28 family peptidase [Sphingomicrobium sp.]